ncbi:hypothetical protein HZ326_5131 [Fusarium oxysporum f. sp. albedinis]|nr:hypothetical protein HZ326_5131 [Fusarium oxysporum f. sp. albedinis]
MEMNIRSSTELKETCIPRTLTGRMASFEFTFRSAVRQSSLLRTRGYILQPFDVLLTAHPFARYLAIPRHLTPLVANSMSLRS